MTRYKKKTYHEKKELKTTLKKIIATILFPFLLQAMLVHIQLKEQPPIVVIVNAPPAAAEPALQPDWLMYIPSPVEWRVPFGVSGITARR